MLQLRSARSTRAPAAGRLHSNLHVVSHFSRLWPLCAYTTTTEITVDKLQYWDVVEYISAVAPPPNQQKRRLGLVQQVTAYDIQVSPLVEEEEGVWVPDEHVEQQQVAVADVLQIVEHVYGQRQDQEHNPHGEHAHDVWQVLGAVPDEVYRGNWRKIQ